MPYRATFATASLLVAAVLLTSSCSAWMIQRPSLGRSSGRYQNEQTLMKANEADSDSVCSLSRRRYFQYTSHALGLGLAALLGPQSSVAADDRLFRPNPLTNSVLEQFRIWDQAEADQLKYGGELERGDAKLSTADQYAKLLIPILRISDDLQQVDQLIHQDDGQLASAQKILSQSTYNKVQMKKVFNSFADNIYYADPDRANVYLAGGAVPNNEQSLAYLLRNDLLTAVEAMQAEVDYLLQHADEPKDDLFKYSQQALSAMQQYLKIVPPGEITKAREFMVAATQ